MTISAAKRQARMAEWQNNIRDRQNSGMTIKEWCRRNGLSEARYYYWLKLIREEAIGCAAERRPEMSLMRIEPEHMPVSHGVILPTASKTHEGVVVRYGNATVEFPVETGVMEIAALVKALNVI